MRNRQVAAAACRTKEKRNIEQVTLPAEMKICKPDKGLAQNHSGEKHDSGDLLQAAIEIGR